MRLEAMYDFVLLTPIGIERTEVMSTVILTPDSAKTISDYCEVLSVGADTEGIEVGDIVLRPDPASYEWIDESTDRLYLLVAYSEIPMRFHDVEKIEKIEKVNTED